MSARHSAFYESSSLLQRPHVLKRAVELALTYCQGKSIVNSVNLEDGEEEVRAHLPAREALRRGPDCGLHRRR